MTKLPYKFNFDDPQILKALIKANHKLGELNGAIIVHNQIAIPSFSLIAF